MRGDIYRLPNNPNARGHAQQGARYGVVIQSDRIMLSTAVVAPTSTSAADSLLHPVIDMSGTRTLVLVPQLWAVDTSLLGNFVGRLDAHELADVDEAVRLVLGLL